MLFWGVRGLGPGLWLWGYRARDSSAVWGCLDFPEVKGFGIEVVYLKLVFWVWSIYGD